MSTATAKTVREVLADLQKQMIELQKHDLDSLVPKGQRGRKPSTLTLLQQKCQLIYNDLFGNIVFDNIRMALNPLHVEYHNLRVEQDQIYQDLLNFQQSEKWAQLQEMTKNLILQDASPENQQKALEEFEEANKENEVLIEWNELRAELEDVSNRINANSEAKKKQANRPAKKD